MLARSTRDLLNTLDAIAAGAGFRSLGDTRADTTTPDGRLKLTVLGGLAECERELIRSHARDGASPEAHGAPEARSDPAARPWREDACGRESGAVRERSTAVIRGPSNAKVEHLSHFVPMRTESRIAFPEQLADTREISRVVA
jgi:hypothetical protein